MEISLKEPLYVPLSQMLLTPPLMWLEAFSLQYGHTITFRCLFLLSFLIIQSHI